MIFELVILPFCSEALGCFFPADAGEMLSAGEGAIWSTFVLISYKPVHQ